MKCKLNLKAPNGKNSQLFEDIVATTPSMEDAINTYYYTKTEQFQNHYRGKVDPNGEPMLSEFTNSDEYDFSADFTKVELDEAAGVYVSLLDRIPTMIATIDENVSYLQRVKGDKNNIKKLVELRKVLENEPINTSILKFTSMAKAHTDNLRRRALKAQDDSKITIKTMDNYHKAAQSYSILTEVENLLAETPAIAEILVEDMSDLAQIRSNLLKVENAYLKKARTYLAEEFHKRDKSWSKAEIIKELKETPRDANWMQQMLEYMGDSHDKVLSMVGRVMMEAEHTKRREGLDFAKRLQERLEQLEKNSAKSGEAIFEDAIIELPTGELHVVDMDAVHTGGRNKVRDLMAERAERIKQDPALAEFVTFYNTEMKKLNAALPSKEGVGTRVPTVLRSEWELMQGKSMSERYDLIADAAKKKFQRSNLDMELGQLTDAHGKPLRRIPIFYNKRYDSLDYEKYKKEFMEEFLAQGLSEEDARTKAEAYAETKAVKRMGELVSRDLASSLQSFHTMAINYAAKNELIYIFDAAENIVGSNSRRYIKTNNAGQTVINANTGQPEVVFGPDSKAFKQLQTFLNMQLYGQKEADLGFVNVGGIKYDSNSLLRALNTSTGYIMQSANVLAGFGNYFNGEYNNVMEAVGGEFYTVSDYKKASAVYKDNIFGIMNDIGARTPNNIVNLLEEHYNLLQSFGGEKLTTSERTKAKRLMKLNSAYFIQASGEHFMQIRAGLATMNKIEVFDKDGNAKGNLLDKHTVKNGKLDIESGLFIKERDGSLVPYDKIQQNRVADRIGAMLRKLHGNYSNTTANAAQQDARLALMLKFRGWMYEGVMRRWGKSREFHLLEGDREGFYRTGWKALGVLARDLKQLQLTMTKEHWANLTEHEKANIRRAVVEASAITATFIAGALLGKAGKMVDDEFNSESYSDRLALGAYQMLVYQTNRLYTEIFAYLNPIEAVRLTRTPMAASNIVENILKVMGEIAELPLNGFQFEKYEAGWRKDQYKIAVQLEKLIPIYKQVATLNADGIKDRGAWLPQ